MPRSGSTPASDRSVWLSPLAGKTGSLTCRKMLYTSSTNWLRRMLARESGSGDMAVSSSSSGGDTARPDYLVAVGASAGGLEALIELVGRFRAPGAALVIVQHLSPDHRSMMADLLSRHTDWPVQAVREGEQVRRANVYLIPPGKQLTIDNSLLHLAPRKSQRGVSHPIDEFMLSVSRSWGPRSIAVILSGTGTDGAEGIRAVSKAGGRVLVQDPNEAAFDGMPRSAVETGVAETVLPVAGLVTHLQSIVSEQPPENAASEAASDMTDTSIEAMPAMDLSEAQVQEILRILRESGAGDFGGYKTDALLRRVDQRCRLLRYADPTDYLALLADSESERTFLARELLIPLTHFFRDPAVFEHLSAAVVKPLVEQAAGKRELRVWCAGVATGEEAYSVSMLFLEAGSQLGVPVDLKLFATDIDGRLVDQGAEGTYSVEHVESEVSAVRRQRWFEPVDESGYRARRAIRSPIVFARHNLVSDPPFTRVDLVVCRNVLIYLRHAAQQQVLERLHYSLKPGGYLLLGHTETPGSLAERFETIAPDPASQDVTGLYRLRRSAPPARFQSGADGHSNRNSPLSPADAESSGPGIHRGGGGFGPDSDESQVVDRLQKRIQAAYLPPTLILNGRGELVHVFGDVQNILRIGSGAASFRLDRILPPGFLPATQALVDKALSAGADSSSPMRGDTATGDDGSVYRLEAQSVALPDQSPFIAVSFLVENPGSAASRAVPVNTGGRSTEGLPSDWEQYARNLERELTSARLSERRSIEALESTNEELQASNEEMTTSNEELQSTNEELQSLNEELYSVNAELQEKIRQLNQLHHDLDNMGHALGVASVFVDQDLRIRRYTEGITQFVPLTARDVGRYLGEFALDHLSTELLDDIRRCISEGHYVETEIASGENGGTSMSWLRIMPYFERAQQVTGAVVLLSNLSMVQALVQQKPVIDALPQQLLVLDDQKHLLLANRPDSDWPASAHAALMQSLQLAPESDLVEQSDLMCEQRWFARARAGDSLARALLDCMAADSGRSVQVSAGDAENELSLIRIWSRPVRQGKRSNYLIVLQSEHNT